jgi:hypothetical protein
VGGDTLGALKLSEFDERTQANLDVVLDEICGELPHGGDLESRRAIAEQLCRRYGAARPAFAN